jgi:branched-chain amino acid transport system permease protein
MSEQSDTGVSAVRSGALAPDLTAETSVGVAEGTRVRRATASSRVFAVVAVALCAWLLVLALGESAAMHRQLVEVCTYVVLASMWNLLAGYTGLVSIGQQAFFGLGAYSLIVFANGYERDIYVSVLAAGVIALLAAIPIGLLAFRLRGGYFAIGTWVIAEVVRLLVQQYKDPPILGGSGTSLDVHRYDPLARTQWAATLAVSLAILAVGVVYLVLRSRLGLGLQAIRDSEGAAEGSGVGVYRTRFVVWLIAAGFTGAAAAIYYVQFLRVQPTSAFSVSNWTAPIIVMVVVGGLGTIEGPVIGAVLWYVLRDRLNDLFDERWFLFGSGVIAVLCALFLRRGLWGALAARFPRLQLFPLRRQVDIPGVVPDHRAAAS